MKQKLYIETTVVSYLTSRKTTNRIIAGHQESTKIFWRRLKDFDAFFSDLVLQEAGRGDPTQAKARLGALAALTMVETDQEAKKLASVLIAEHAVPLEYPDDAMHIAIATVNGMDFIVTWNFSHINNPFTRMMIRQLAENSGYIAPEICSPEELLGDEL